MERLRHRGLLFWLRTFALWAAATSAGRLPYLYAKAGARLPANFGRDFVAASVPLPCYAALALFATAALVVYRGGSERPTARPV